jgi:hypothetical protein
MRPASQRRRGLEVHVIAKVPQMDGGSPLQSPSPGRSVSAAIMLSISQYVHYVPVPRVPCFSSSMEDDCPDSMFAHSLSSFWLYMILLFRGGRRRLSFVDGGMRDRLFGRFFHRRSHERLLRRRRLVCKVLGVGRIGGSRLQESGRHMRFGDDWLASIHN